MALEILDKKLVFIISFPFNFDWFSVKVYVDLVLSNSLNLLV